MAVKHNKVSAVTDSGDTSVVQPSDWNADHVVDAGGIKMATGSTPPSSPASGNVQIWGRTNAGRAMPAFTEPNGLNSFTQPFFARNKIGIWAPLGNTNSAPISNFGISPAGFTGTATTRTVATTNLLTSMRRVGVVSAATAGNTSRVSPGVVQFWRGNAAGLGGFHMVFRWGCSDAATVAGARTFVGLASVTSVGNVDPSSLINVIGIGTDGTDSNLQIFTNDGTGTATKIDLGANFPDHTLSVDAYELALFCPPNGSFINWEVTRLNTGHTASGQITTDLPVNTQLLCPQFVRSNNTAALAVGIDVIGLYTETDN